MQNEIEMNEMRGDSHGDLIAHLTAEPHPRVALNPGSWTGPRCAGCGVAPVMGDGGRCTVCAPHKRYLDRLTE